MTTDPSLTLIARVLVEHVAEILSMTPGDPVACTCARWTGASIAGHSLHLAEVLRAALVEAGWRAPEGEAFEPTRWWRVLDEDGYLWCETSVEGEARASMLAGHVLQRLHQRTEYEWRIDAVAQQQESTTPSPPVVVETVVVGDQVLTFEVEGE